MDEIAAAAGLIKLSNGQYAIYNAENNAYEVVTVALEQQEQQEQVSSNADSNDILKTTTASTTPPLENITAVEQNRPNHWTREETLMFLNLCIEHREKLQNPRYKKKDIFTDISTRLKQEGIRFTAIQCENRLKTLITKYREIVDHNSKTGNDNKYWEFEELVSEYLGNRPNVTPVAGCSSRNPQESSTFHDVQEPPIKKNKVHNTPRSEMFKWLKSYEDNIKAQEAKRMEIAERHHAENKELLLHLIDTLKK